MARSTASRKWQVTINNPIDNGYTHEQIKEVMTLFKNTVYWCMCDEIGEEGTYHTHVFIVFKSAVMFKTMQKRFYGCHLEMVKGTNMENRDYIRKEGKWADNKKKETNLINTFEEYGEIPIDMQGSASVNEEIYEMIKNNATNAEILEAFPSALCKLDHFEKARQTILAERFKNIFRKLEVTYIWGDTGTGKTRGIMEEFGYSNVYRVTDYDHPFDGYKGQDIIMFEEFRSSLKIEDMLKYLDGYPCELPCRYANKTACFTKVFFTTNIPLENQYPNIQHEQPKTWKAFTRRIHNVDCKNECVNLAEGEFPF